MRRDRRAAVVSRRDHPRLLDLRRSAPGDSLSERLRRAEVCGVFGIASRDAVISDSERAHSVLSRVVGTFDGVRRTSMGSAIGGEREATMTQ